MLQDFTSVSYRMPVVMDDDDGQNNTTDMPKSKTKTPGNMWRQQHHKKKLWSNKYDGSDTLHITMTSLVMMMMKKRRRRRRRRGKKGE